jgi:nucleoside-diphosphate-sugar epimerase
MGDPITLFGDGTETRDFVFSRDIANLVCKLVHASPRRIEAQPHHINVASGRSVQIKEVARMLLHQLGSQCGLQFSGQRSPGDPSRWSVDLQDQGEFSLTHPTPLEQGLAIYARWIRSITENNDADRVLATAG